MYRILYVYFHSQFYRGLILKSVIHEERIEQGIIIIFIKPLPIISLRHRSVYYDCIINIPAAPDGPLAPGAPAWPGAPWKEK